MNYRLALSMNVFISSVSKDEHIKENFCLKQNNLQISFVLNEETSKQLFGWMQSLINQTAINSISKTIPSLTYVQEEVVEYIEICSEYTQDNNYKIN